MHPSVMTYVEEIVERYALNVIDSPVLEVGSYNENGSVARLFCSTDYIGVDMRPGPGVDLVCYADNLPFADSTYDVVVTTEMLEHDRKPWRSIAEMVRVLRPGGYLIVTARGFNQYGCFPFHGYPDDHWRYSLGAMSSLLEDCNLHIISLREDPTDPGVFATARKP